MICQNLVVTYHRKDIVKRCICTTDMTWYNIQRYQMVQMHHRHDIWQNLVHLHHRKDIVEWCICSIDAPPVELCELAPCIEMCSCTTDMIYQNLVQACHR